MQLLFAFDTIDAARVHTALLAPPPPLWDAGPLYVWLPAASRPPSRVTVQLLEASPEAIDAANVHTELPFERDSGDFE